MADAQTHRAHSTPETVSVEGHRVAYAEYGDPSGDPIVAFHGTPGSRLFGALLDGQAREREQPRIRQRRRGEQSLAYAHDTTSVVCPLASKIASKSVV